ncbi:hypothetical protein BGZ76_010789 [Entomortierella beljakovae]|nr:hypothetical protein BGZ76_010789 [Entomortierella beljakovae]
MEELKVLLEKSADALTSGHIKEAYFGYLDILDAAALELRKIKFVTNVALTSSSTVSLISLTRSSVASVHDILGRQNAAIAAAINEPPTSPRKNRYNAGHIKSVTMLSEQLQSVAASTTVTPTPLPSVPEPVQVPPPPSPPLPLSVTAASVEYSSVTAVSAAPSSAPVSPLSVPVTSSPMPTSPSSIHESSPSIPVSPSSIPMSPPSIPVSPSSMPMSPSSIPVSPSSVPISPPSITVLSLSVTAPPLTATTAPVSTVSSTDQKSYKDESPTSPLRSPPLTTGSSSPIIYSPLLRSATVNIPSKPTRRAPFPPFSGSLTDSSEIENNSNNFGRFTQLSNESQASPPQHLHPLLESPPQMRPPLPPKPARYRKISEPRNSDELSLDGLSSSSSDEDDDPELPQVHNPRPQLLQRKTSSPSIAIPKSWRRMGPSASEPASPTHSPTNIPSSCPSSNIGTRSLGHSKYALLRHGSSGSNIIIPEGCVDPLNLVEAERINGDDQSELDQKTYGPSDHLPMIPVSPLRTTHRSLVEKEKSWSNMLAETRQKIQEIYVQKQQKEDSNDPTERRKSSEDDAEFQLLQEDACKYTSQVGNIMATMTKVRELLYRSAGTTSILEFPPYLVAYQLTLIESAIFLEILPKSLLTHSPKTPDSKITASTDFFNYLTRMIEYSVLFPAEAGGRAQIMNHWVKVAVKLHELANFQTLKAVLCALGTPPIKRLKRTWGFLPRKSVNKFETLSDLMSEDRNYGKYRDMINSLRAGATVSSPEVSSPLSDSSSSMSGSRFEILNWSSNDIKTKDPSRRPMIPFLGTFIMDMTYLLAAVKKSNGQGNSAHPVLPKIPPTSSLSSHRETNLTVNTAFLPEDDHRLNFLLGTLTSYQSGPRYSPQPSRSYIKASTKSQNHFRAPSLSSALQMTTKYRNFSNGDRDRQFAFDDEDEEIPGGTGIRSMQQLILHYLLTRPWAPEKMVDELSTIREPPKNDNVRGHSKSASSGWSSGSISSWPGIGTSSSIHSQSSTTSFEQHTSIGSAESSRPTSMEDE